MVNGIDRAAQAAMIVATEPVKYISIGRTTNENDKCFAGYHCAAAVLDLAEYHTRT